MGPLSGLLDMLPGAGQMKQQMQIPDIDESVLESAARRSSSR